MNVKKTGFAALLVALGLTSSVFVYASVNQPSEYPLELAANETDNSMPAASTEEPAAEETALPEMNMEELQAEIQKACDELAADESVTEENRTSFIEDCVSENTPIEGAPDDEMSIDAPVVDDAAAPIDDAAPVDEELPPEEDAAPKVE